MSTPASPTRGEHGEDVPGPPWILGHRGAPIDAPENTLVSLRRALDLGLDGVEYDLHACATGEPVLIHDETLERTTDRSGPVALLTLPELAGVDAGSWFHARFRGEPLPLLDEALHLEPAAGGPAPQHMIELKDPTLVSAVARRLEELERPLSVRIASFRRRVVEEAEGLGLPAMLLAIEANEDDRRYVRDARIAAYGTGPAGWRTSAGGETWDCERWSWSVDEPQDLLEACRLPLFGFNTNQPLRALAVRALLRHAPGYDGPYPLGVPPLEVPLLDEGPGEHGEWSGRWSLEITVRNPLPVKAEVALGLAVRGGAFEATGFPAAVRLGPRAEAQVPVTLAGGSWSPCEDPAVFARYAFRPGPGRPVQHLILDHSLERVRSIHVSEEPRRLKLLVETPGQPPASMTLARKGHEVVAWVEDPGGVKNARAELRVGEVVRRGGRGVRVRLPERRPDDTGALPFGVGFSGTTPEGEAVRRRHCGGLPYGLRSGAPGRLFVEGRG